MQKAGSQFPGQDECRITAEMRQQLHARRLEHGLTCARVGELLGVHGTTVQKWERGRTGRCGIVVRNRLLQFLEGKLPPGTVLYGEGQRDTGSGDGVADADDGGIEVVLRRAQRLHALCVKETRPELGEELARRLSADVDDVFHKLAGD